MVTAAVALKQDEDFNTGEQNFRAYAKLLPSETLLEFRLEQPTSLPKRG
jgi:hypothetical protein